MIDLELVDAGGSKKKGGKSQKGKDKDKGKESGKKGGKGGQKSGSNSGGKSGGKSGKKKADSLDKTAKGSKKQRSRKTGLRRHY